MTLTAAQPPIESSTETDASAVADETTLKILISDKVAPECLAALDDAKAEPGAALTYDYRPGLRGAELLAAIPAYHGLIVRSGTQVTREVLAVATRLRAVVRAGVGVDNIDLASATERGVLIMNCPTGNTVAAAEHSIAMLCALARRIPEAHASLQAGEWKRSAFVGTEIAGKVLGVLGLGKVGREVVKRGRGLGMKVMGYDPFVTAEAAAAMEIETGTLDEVIAKADFLTLHVPLIDSTRGLLNARTLAQTKRGVRIINVARGGVIDSPALAEAVRSGQVAGAAIDVFEQEPPPADHPLIGLPGVILTPHLGASTKEAQELVGIQSARQLTGYLRDGLIVSAVNTVALDPALVKRMESWRSLCEKLGSFQGQLRSGAVRRVTIRYAGERFGADERKLLTLAFLQGFLRQYTDQPVNYVNAALFAKARGVAVHEEVVSETSGYANVVGTEVETSDSATHDIRVRRAAGTVFGERHLRFVQLDGYRIEAVPAGSMVLVSNNDTPGIVGAIGTTLGARGVNIASMSMGRDATGGTAVAILNLDSPLPDPVLAAIRALPGVVWVRTVAL